MQRCRQVLECCAYLDQTPEIQQTTLSQKQDKLKQAWYVRYHSPSSAASSMSYFGYSRCPCTIISGSIIIMLLSPFCYCSDLLLQYKELDVLSKLSSLHSK